MKLTFLGTRGEIEHSNHRHRRHTSLLVEYKRRRVMIDCGEDWRDQVFKLSPHAIVITHAHPDHAFGLENGSPCVVYATRETWERIDDYPIKDRKTMPLAHNRTIEGIRFRAFTVEHSLRAPAVGYRITAGRHSIFYVPDLVYIHERRKALHGTELYIGDGATMTRSLVRRRGDRLIGHTPVRTQLTWCQKEGVPRAIITHCGSGIVAGDERKVGAQLRKMATERGVEAEIAYDGVEIVLR
jgi:phosphoribosyl 1,2-cyclic phosphodiesterase